MIGRLKGLYDKTISTATSAFSNAGGGAVVEKTRELQNRLMGRPAVIADLARLKAAQREKMRQIEALEKTKSSISRATYDNLRGHYEDELLELNRQCAELQEEANSLRAEQLVEKHAIETELAELRRQENEIKTVFQAGALNQTQFRQLARELQQNIAGAEARLRKSLRDLAYIETQTKAGDSASAEAADTAAAGEAPSP